MSIKLLAVVVLSVANCFLCAAQSKNDVQLVQLYDDNDFIAPRGKGTDRSYTNGVKIDAYYTKNATPKFLSRLLIFLNSSSDNLYGIGLTQLMFTPNDISKSEIITNDRPYAGVLYFNHSLTSADNEKKQRLTTEIDLGVIGSNAFAKETQTGIHEPFNFPKPIGWGNQVNNDIIINYLIRYEKLLLQPSEKLQVVGMLEANAGTLSNNLTTGFIFRAGVSNSYFSNYEKPGVSKSSCPAIFNKKVHDGTQQVGNIILYIAI